MQGPILHQVFVYVSPLSYYLYIDCGPSDAKDRSILRDQNHQGKYGSASSLSTNFLRPASTAGCENNSQKRSISRCNSSYGIGLINFFAAIAVRRSNFPS